MGSPGVLGVVGSRGRGGGSRVVEVQGCWGKGVVGSWGGGG